MICHYHQMVATRAENTLNDYVVINIHCDPLQDLINSELYLSFRSTYIELYDNIEMGKWPSHSRSETIYQQFYQIRYTIITEVRQWNYQEQLRKHGIQERVILATLPANEHELTCYVDYQSRYFMARLQKIKSNDTCHVMFLEHIAG